MVINLDFYANVVECVFTQNVKTHLHLSDASCLQKFVSKLNCFVLFTVFMCSRCSCHLNS